MELLPEDKHPNLNQTKDEIFESLNDSQRLDVKLVKMQIATNELVTNKLINALNKNSKASDKLNISINILNGLLIIAGLILTYLEFVAD